MNTYRDDVSALVRQVRDAINAGVPLAQQQQQQRQQQLPLADLSSCPRGSAVDVPPKSQQPCHPLAVPHKIVAWPYVYADLINFGTVPASDLQSVLREGTVWFIEGDLSKHSDPLPCDIGLYSSVVDVGDAKHGRPYSVSFPALTLQKVLKYCDAYFSTFNLLYPLLDQEAFMDEVVARSLREGYKDGDSGSVLALLVFALGQVAIEGVFDRPVSVLNGKSSGFCGSSFAHPPGLGLFNEARRRLGFLATQCSLENVQIMLLQATYYQSTARHLDFWRSTVAASSACQVLIRCQAIDWWSADGDLVKRAYWTCVLTEELFHLELDLPQTQICTLEDEVPLPQFPELQDQQEDSASLPPLSVGAGEERNYHGYHFLAMITLHLLTSRVHREIHACERNTACAEPLVQSKMATNTHDNPTTFASGVEISDYYGGPPMALVLELVSQLDSWRALLPRLLQWSENDVMDFAASNPTGRRLSAPLFSGRGLTTANHMCDLDIAAAQLRTRFYYARFMVYRPFIYKALHFPDLMTAEDCQCCALAIKSVCLWPLALTPLKKMKLLVPSTWAWPQHFMGILLILNLCSTNDCLRSIVERELIEPQEIEQAVQLMLGWIRDAKQIDGIAERSWNLVKSLYGNHLSDLE